VIDQDFVVPDGFATGCLPRASRFGQWCPLMSERVPVIPVAQWPSLIGEIELRSFVNKVKNQGKVGSCATESTSQGVELTEVLSGQPWTELNPWYVYHTTSGGRDQGSSIDTNLAFVRQNGIAPESVWPRSKGWQTRPSADAVEAAKLHKIEEWYDCTTVTEIGTALLLGYPVVFGWNGHSCVFTHLLTAATAQYCNSWGAQWGDRGFGELSLSSVNFQYGAFAIRTSTIHIPPPEIDE